VVSEFERGYPFPFDDFQRSACGALAEGRSVLVCAPTGAGKTVVGESAVWLALQSGTKCFYTTPLKALSNQKFGDFIARHGAANVGLLTGDNSINGEAPIVVMTTEVLRNMLYESSPTLGGLGFVVLDEVHFLKDPYRGAVWEEILIHLPEGIRVAALSATVSNAEEFGEWLGTVRGDTDVIITEKRPVPLEHILMVGDKLHPLFIRDGAAMKPNPAIRRLAEPKLPHTRDYRRGPPPWVRRAKGVPDRIDVVSHLRGEGMLPAIYFIFSRAGCEQAVRQCRGAHVRLVTPGERERISEYVELRASVLPEEDHDVLGFADWRDGLEAGIASHHAGLIPLFKETVEELFERGLVKVVFATETLSLGINMPARTVVIERLVKFTGEKHELMTPGDFTQLTGRAGRRGIDPVGYGVVLYQPDIPADRILHLASTRTYPLSSSFRPSYNMAVNLVRRYSIKDAERLLNLSFGQFLADRSVTRQERQIERNERFLDGYREHLECDRGDFTEYWALVRQARAAERATRRDGNARRRDQVASLRPGLVVNVKRGRVRGRVAIVDVRRSKGGQPQIVAVTAEGRAARLGSRDFGFGPEVLGELSLPRGDRRSNAFRAEVAKRLNRFTPKDDQILSPNDEQPALPAARGWDAVRTHPCDRCPDKEEHEKWAERFDELSKDTDGLRGVVSRRTESLARTFERVLDVLRVFGYVDGDKLTDKGERLCRIYNESDLLVTEVMEQGLLDEVDVPDLAAVVSTLVYETRGFATDVHWPVERVRKSVGAALRIFQRIHEAELEHRIQLCREPDPGFAEQIWWWAKDEPLENVLAMGELSAGDFVRSTKQVWDLLRQLAEVAPSSTLSSRCRDAARVIYRGVVAYSGAL